MGDPDRQLRSAGKVARILKDTNAPDLRPAVPNINNRFTEGFDTADLKDAKALLEEVNAELS